MGYSSREEGVVSAIDIAKTHARVEEVILLVHVDRLHRNTLVTPYGVVVSAPRLVANVAILHIAKEVKFVASISVKHRPQSTSKEVGIVLYNIIVVPPTSDIIDTIYPRESAPMWGAIETIRATKREVELRGGVRRCNICTTHVVKH